MALFSTLCFSKDLAVFVKKCMILKLSTCNRRSLLCICVCRVCSHNIFHFFVALLKNFPTNSISLKNAMRSSQRDAMEKVCKYTIMT